MWPGWLLSSAVIATLPLSCVGITYARQQHLSKPVAPAQDMGMDAANGMDSLLKDDGTTTTAPISPPTLLLISSSKERKVSYTELKNSEDVNSTVLPLIDAGLMGPAGIAYDSANSALYVADPPVHKIMRYRLKVERCPTSSDPSSASSLEGGAPCKSVFQISVIGSPVVVAKGVLCSWVATDKTGALYFTDQKTKSINRISSDVLRELEEGEVQAEQLQQVSQSESESLAHAANSGEQSGVGHQRAAEAREEAMSSATVSLYQAEGSKNVGTPAGVFSDGVEVYWANMMGGGTSGSVGAGRVVVEGANFPTSTVASKTATAYGVIATYSSVLFTDKQQYLYAVAKTGGSVLTVSTAFLTPRGLAWDGDSTVYVADETGNAVYSLPFGRPAENRPVRLAAAIHGPFGLALVRGTDPAFATVLDGLVPGCARNRCFLTRIFGAACAVFVAWWGTAARGQTWRMG